MTNTTMGSLQEVQKLDERIGELKTRVEEQSSRIAEVEEPALALESEIKGVEDRLRQMETDQRRLERSADDKRSRMKRLEERLEKVQNLREEAAVSTELDMLRRALEGDEHEALQLLDRIRRAEEVRDELAEATEAARAEVEPQQESLLAERGELTDQIEEMQARRESVLASVSGDERKVYEAFHASGRSVVVSPLLDDGACGHCFGMVPLQTQNEIRHGAELIRCEACGVILSADLEPHAVEEDSQGDDEAGSE